jgi:hypothetical protein
VISNQWADEGKGGGIREFRQLRQLPIVGAGLERAGTVLTPGMAGSARWCMPSDPPALRGARQAGGLKPWLSAWKPLTELGGRRGDRSRSGDWKSPSHGETCRRGLGEGDAALAWGKAAGEPGRRGGVE